MTQPETINAIILAAVSAKDQAEDDKFSLDAQINDSRAVAEKNGWNVVDVIRIEGHSRNYRTLAQLAAAARENNEPGFDRLIAHFEKQDFDILICRDANRFARKPSLLYEIVDTILEDCGARIYSLSDGMVDANNADMWLMVKGYEIRKQMQWLKTEMQRGRYKLVELGLPMGNEHVWSHMRVRDDKFKTVDFIPDPDKQSVIYEAAQLVVNRVSWRQIEKDLFEMGFAQKNGKPYLTHHFYHVFYNPWFWGDAVRNHTYRQNQSGRSVELWMVDPSVPIPDGVVMYRDKIEPAIKGDLAIKLRAELIRRITSRPRQHRNTHHFSGLLVCGRCGFTMAYHDTGKNIYYECGSKYVASERARCTRKWLIRESEVKAWMNEALRLMIESNHPYLLADPNNEALGETRLQSYYKDLEQIETQIRRIIEKQAHAPESVSSLYDDQIEAFATQREKLLATIQTTEQKQQLVNQGDINLAYRELTTYETLEHFWQDDPGVINQLLHRLMGKRRLAIRDRKVVGTVEYRRRSHR
jgi:uncharacterized protein YchJ